MSSASAEPQPIQVALVEDDDGIRVELAHRIGRSPLFRLLRSYPSAVSALSDLPRRQPDVVLMDINLSSQDGVECVRRLKAAMPRVRFLMLAVYEDGDRLFKALLAGASGYLLKRSTSEKLLTAIQEVHQGRAPMSPEMARRVVQHFRGLPETAAESRGLTPREKEVLGHLSRGYLYGEIEGKLGISVGTLRGHVAKIYDKLHAPPTARVAAPFVKS